MILICFTFRWIKNTTCLTKVGSKLNKINANQETGVFLRCLNTRTPSATTTTISERVNKLKVKMLQIFDSVSSAEEIDVLEKIFAPVEPTLRALRKNTSKIRYS